MRPASPGATELVPRSRWVLDGTTYIATMSATATTGATRPARSSGMANGRQ